MQHILTSGGESIKKAQGGAYALASYNVSAALVLAVSIAAPRIGEDQGPGIE